MDHETLETMIRKAMEQSGSQISFGWQGGEPTLMGLDFYREAVELQNFYGKNKRIENSIQTNGILIDQDWAEFLKKNRFLTGLSIDGPRDIHDAFRMTSHGKGSSALVEKSAKLLIEAGAEVNALTVVTSESVKYPDEIYQYLKDLGLSYMQFIPCVEQDQNDPSSAAPYSVPPEQLGDFLCRLFDLWIEDFSDGKPSTYIRNFESLLFPYAGRTCPDCTFQRTCGNYLVVEHNGEVYSCDFFVDDAWLLGTVQEDSLIEMLNSPRQQMFGNLKVKLQKKCLNCRWLWICRGGCTKDRLQFSSDRKVSHLCQAYKKFLSYSDARMKNLVKDI